MIPADARVVLRSLALRDFRNLARLDLVIPSAGVAIVGENGQGKSNLLEAVYYLHLLRSVRGARDVDVIRFGAAGFHVAARAEGGVHHELTAGFERTGRRKRVKLDGIEPPRLSDALGALPCVLFSPADVDLVAGAPSARRRYLDILLALSSRPYLAALQRYRHALAQRNAALRDAVRSTGARSEQRVAVWEAPLAEHGATLWCERVAWASQASPRFAEMCAAIGEQAPVGMRYATALEPTSREPADVRDAIARALEQKRGLDVRRGITHAGPHRDDLALTLDGRELRAFGSAGQQRTAAIALRLLEGDTLRERRGAAPLLLLDDPFAELDVRRSSRILELLAAHGMGQTILTVPRETDIPPALTQLDRWRIEAGVVHSDRTMRQGAA
ncbi:MAG: DNA replication and repair protein RecF [Gemmatimonadaceae bacterium]|nr:DNA replication and repair protein RecF [Gemmatimonadaceae bacterium]NUO95446.1 DNA replication and repair protein RecF [Gemmatimonadaceae bacterium]NUP55416.1 DNA replication and repair protein RecF [Gemmatimonadaceae bacterium]NUP72831.1 DNA replication and repair protein RecF [Gemmatimonadaceae bacterium]NUR33764.1 DNA replication and repair protein RecF [Gemmatimonadaceae bacterium]